MRATTASIVALLGLIGCGSASGPLMSGKLVAGSFCTKPLTATSYELVSYAAGSRVEVYEGFVVVIASDGLSHVYPQSNVSGLVIRRD